MDGGSVDPLRADRIPTMRRWFSSLLSLHLWMGVAILAWAGFGTAVTSSGHLADVPALSEMAVELIHSTVAMEPATGQPAVDVSHELPELLQAMALSVSDVRPFTRPGTRVAHAWVAPALDGPHRPPRNTHHA
jgi:hypothetical protein